MNHRTFFSVPCFFFIIITGFRAFNGRRLQLLWSLEEEQGWQCRREKYTHKSLMGKHLRRDNGVIGVCVCVGKEILRLSRKMWCGDVNWTELLQCLDHTIWRCTFYWIISVFWLQDVVMLNGLNYPSVLTTGCGYVNWTELLQCFDYRIWRYEFDWITSVLWLQNVNMWIGLNYLSVSTTGCEDVNWTELHRCFDCRVWRC